MTISLGVRRKLRIAGALAATVAAGLAGCGSGEGTVKINPDVRKNLADQELPKDSKPSPYKGQGSDGELKSRLGGKSND